MSTITNIPQPIRCRKYCTNEEGLLLIRVMFREKYEKVQTIYLP